MATVRLLRGWPPPLKDGRFPRMGALKAARYATLVALRQSKSSSASRRSWSRRWPDKLRARAPALPGVGVREDERWRAPSCHPNVIA